MKVTKLTIFRDDLIKEPYYCLQIEGIDYIGLIEIERNEAIKFKNKIKYQETIIYKEAGFITRIYKII
ncbi:hypothetical protein [Tenacibaculum maritimum]|uniref:hypothetical protein n=1 Tax=Tenacibaculum maritimum TaxID=107401 RepID=UPI00387649E1